MLRHQEAVEFLVSLLTKPHTDFRQREVAIEGRIVEDHLDDFEKWFKTPDLEYSGLGYRTVNTGEAHRERTVQFFMFALGRESERLKLAAK